MELPTSNRKKVIDIWLTGLVAKIDPFSIFWKVKSRKPLDLHRWKFAQIFFQALSASVPNFIEIGGGSRKFSKKLVDLTRNDRSTKGSVALYGSTAGINTGLQATKGSVALYGSTAASILVYKLLKVQ